MHCDVTAQLALNFASASAQRGEYRVREITSLLRVRRVRERRQSINLERLTLDACVTYGTAFERGKFDVKRRGWSAAMAI